MAKDDRRRTTGAQFDLSVDTHHAPNDKHRRQTTSGMPQEKPHNGQQPSLRTEKLQSGKKGIVPRINYDVTFRGKPSVSQEHAHH